MVFPGDKYLITRSLLKKHGRKERYSVTTRALYKVLLIIRVRHQQVK